MTSRNPEECYDLSTENGGTLDTQIPERPETQPAGTDASSLDQDRPAFADEEKESEFLTHKFIPPSSLTLGSEQHICERLKHLMTSRPAPALAFTDESTASHSQGRDPTEEEAKQVLKKHGLDQEELQQDHENHMALRSYDTEERMPAVVVTQPDESDEQEGPEEDTRSITASSVMSLFHRVQMDPIEREWLRCAALGNATTLYLLLQQDPTLVSKKTALHWAAKQGRVEMADMMARSGADVNQRAGYTPLHLASLHGHGEIIQLLINNYNARDSIRDYHGKMAAHYWNGSKDLFTEYRSPSVGSWSKGRRVQCYTQLSALLSRSHSNRNISEEASGRPLELIPLNRSSSSC
ncbi:ankyrin repeat domain-containing protein SOWAHA isoform X3 [Pseudorasbora parva]|uniref:ankyrin repeat domain-containing protein SOWAHA isoform X3 n=1 Tax=Pseudorasbora parva TaxID=51549 RepID=UPI00351DE2B3